MSEQNKLTIVLQLLDEIWEERNFDYVLVTREEYAEQEAELALYKRVTDNLAVYLHVHGIDLHECAEQARKELAEEARAEAEEEGEPQSYFPGIIDKVACSDRPLSPPEITAAYHHSRGFSRARAEAEREERDE